MGQASSFVGNTGGNAESAPNNPEAAWWCKLLARVIGSIGGFIALIMGIWTCVSVKPICIIAGILQMMAAVVCLVFEAPICCTFVEATKPIARFAENRTFFQKAIIFGAISIPPIAMCFGLSTLFGAGLIFATGVIYGLMALGKKADREQMMANAQTQQQPGQTGGAAGGGTGQQGQWGDDKAGLVEQDNPWANQGQGTTGIP